MPPAKRDRMSTKARAMAYAFIAARDGDECASCHCAPHETPHPLEIDHIDESQGNWTITNLQLLCKPCNVKKANGARRRDKGARQHDKDAPPSQASLIPSVARERENPASRLVAQVSGFAHGEPSQRANLLYEPVFRAWVLQHIDRHGFISETDAINGGAEVSGANPRTTALYLAKLTSIAGPLVPTNDLFGRPVITYKEQP